MHEMALAESVLAIAEDTARRHAAREITTVSVEIGALAHVAPEALRFCFEAVQRDSLAAHATLEIRTTPGQAWCMVCGVHVPLAARGDACPHCGRFQLTVVAGDALRVCDIRIV